MLEQVLEPGERSEGPENVLKAQRLVKTSSAFAESSKW